jgi:hypothetical protein
MRTSATPLPKYVQIGDTKWTPELIKERIETSDKAVKNALLRIWGWQTEAEKETLQTHESNGVGFNGVDAEILTSFAEQLTKKGWLSHKQIALARKKLKKYSRQIYVHHVAKQFVEMADSYGI